MFCQSVMYFQTPANSLKLTPPLFSRSNIAEKKELWECLVTSNPQIHTLLTFYWCLDLLYYLVLLSDWSIKNMYYVYKAPCIHNILPSIWKDWVQDPKNCLRWSKYCENVFKKDHDWTVIVVMSIHLKWAESDHLILELGIITHSQLLLTNFLKKSSADFCCLRQKPSTFWATFKADDSYIFPVWAETTEPFLAKCANRKHCRLSWSSQTNRGL